MKLSTRLALYIAAIAIILTALMSVLSYVYIHKRVAEASDSSIVSLIETVSSMASTAAYIEDSELAREVVKGLAINKQVSCARLSTLSMSVSSAAECQGRLHSAVDVVSPWDAEETVGRLEVYRNQAFVEQQAKQQVYYAAFILLAVIVLISAVIAVVTFLLITKPISAISAKLSVVDFEHDIHLLDEAQRSDELGVIGRVINLMLINAKKQIIVEQILARRTEEISKHVQLVFQLSANYLAVCDEKLRLRSCNPKFSALVDAYKNNDQNLMHTDNWIGAFTENPDDLKATVFAHPDIEQPFTIDIEIANDDESDVLGRRYFSFTFVRILVEGNEASIFIYIVDLTDHKRKLAVTEYEANHDSLTKLYNRLAAMRKIRYLLSGYHDDQKAAILFIDLDGFKAINDSLGHEAGDDLLKIIARRISSSVRRTDVAARWGGDEFLVALDCVNVQQAMNVAEKILDSIVNPIVLRDENGESVERFVGASIGVALSSSSLGDFDTLYERADKAMYMVKKNGKNAVLLWDENLG